MLAIRHGAGGRTVAVTTRTRLRTQVFIDGAFRDASSGETFPTENPATGEVIAEVAAGDAADIDAAVRAARRAFDDGRWSRMAPADRKKRVEDALNRVGMSHRARHMPGQLSGGQQQRVAVARAVAGDPLILLADEPTGNLDSKNGQAVMKLLSELHQGGSTLIMVTHDPSYARLATRTVSLFDGRIVEETGSSAA